MKKTTGVTLGVIMSALIATGCGDEKQRCVDAKNVVVSEEHCKDSDTYNRTGVFPGGYLWYYGGSGHTFGTMATGGGYVSRGGFGSSSSSHASAAG